jgi:hypothetical protein
MSSGNQCTFWPDGNWGCIDPPGPSSGFDTIRAELTSGRVPLSAVGASIGVPSYRSSVSVYMDGYFVADASDGSLREVAVEAFRAAVLNLGATPSGHG